VGEENSTTILDVEVFMLTEGNNLAADTARMPEAAGVPSPGHAFKGILQEIGKTSQSLVATKWGDIVGGRGQPEIANEGLRGIL